MTPKPPPPVPLDPAQLWLIPAAFPSAGDLWDAEEPDDPALDIEASEDEHAAWFCSGAPSELRPTQERKS